MNMIPTVTTNESHGDYDIGYVILIASIAASIVLSILTFNLAPLAIVPWFGTLTAIAVNEWLTRDQIGGNAYLKL